MTSRTPRSGWIPRAERFVQLVVGGGLALVAGLWVVTLTAPASLAWLAGLFLVALGVVGLAAGIWTELDV